MRATLSLLQRLLISPKKVDEVAVALGIPKALAKAWLQRLVQEGVIRQQRRPAGYVVARELLFRQDGFGTDGSQSGDGAE